MSDYYSTEIIRVEKSNHCSYKKLNHTPNANYYYNSHKNKIPKANKT